jgi:hypothetical protein
MKKTFDFNTLFRLTPPVKNCLACIGVNRAFNSKLVDCFAVSCIARDYEEVERKFLEYEKRN